MAQYEAEVTAYVAEHPLYASWLAASTKRAAAAAKAKGKAKRGAKAGKGNQNGGKAGKKKTPAGNVEAEDSEGCSVRKTEGLHNLYLLYVLTTKFCPSTESEIAARWNPLLNPPFWPWHQSTLAALLGTCEQ